LLLLNNIIAKITRTPIKEDIDIENSVPLYVYDPEPRISNKSGSFLTTKYMISKANNGVNQVSAFIKFDFLISMNNIDNSIPENMKEKKRYMAASIKQRYPSVTKLQKKKLVRIDVTK